MKKFCFIVILSLFSLRVYGIHNLLINGSSAPTVTTIDALVITASFDGGTVANATMYYDINDNGQLDSGDPWIMKSKLIDGGFDDEDETSNGSYHEIGNPLAFQGKFLFYAEDNGVSDTVLLIVNPASSSHSVSGTVTDPANQSHILVTTIKIIDLESGKFKYGYGDFTAGDGSYSISVPSEVADQFWNIVAIDMANVVPFYSSNDVLNDSIYISGAVTKDIAMCLAPTDTRTEVSGELKDDLGNLITEPAKITGIGAINGMTDIGSAYKSMRPGETDGSGAYKIYLKQGTSGYFYIYIANASVAGQFYPEFMNPIYQKVGPQFPPAPTQITLNFKAYRTTNTISGYVTKDGMPYDKCHLDCSAVGYGGTYTKTLSDGFYMMPVSDSASSYTITIAKKSVPEGYEANPPSQTASPGATGIDFNLSPAVEEVQKELQKPLLVIYPNPFVCRVVFELSYSEPTGVVITTGDLAIYDIAGNCVTTLKPETHNGLHQFVLSEKEKLPNGIYFYSLKIRNKVLKGKVVKLQ